MEAIKDKDKLLQLCGNLNELQINNLLEILSIYTTERYLEEIAIRLSSEEINYKFEDKMKGLVEFADFVQSLLKK